MRVPAYARTRGWGWIPASVFTGAGCPRGKGDGVDARTIGRGTSSRLPSLRGQAVRGGTGMGPRMLRGQRVGGGFPLPLFTDTGGGMSSRFRLCGGGDSIARTMGGDWGRGTGGSRTAPTEGEYCRALGSPPSPVFTRAGSNLPPSRGKGFVGDERAIFTVMTCGECAALRSGGGTGRRRCLGGAIVA